MIHSQLTHKCGKSHPGFTLDQFRTMRDGIVEMVGNLLQCDGLVIIMDEP